MFWVTLVIFGLVFQKIFKKSENRNSEKLVLGTSTRSRSRFKLFSPTTNSNSDSNFFLKYPIANQTRSRLELDDRVEIFWVVTRISVATRSKILDCFHQAAYPGKFSVKFLGRDPKNFLGSRPKTGRDRYFFLGPYRFLDFWVDGPQH
jgi:hypothetical protein